MRFTAIIVLALVIPLAGCHLLPWKKSSRSKEHPKEVSEGPVVRSEPGLDCGPYPTNFQLRTIEAFQAKWPADVTYKYRFEMPRRVQNTSTQRYGYAVRFRAQKAAAAAPMPEGFPWIAYFEYGKIVWVQRDTEVADTVKWFDPVQVTVDWPQAPQTN
jgi:hypothetical protein